MTLVCMRLSKHTSDRGLVLLACVLYALGALCACLLWDYHMTIWQFVVGDLAMITAVPLAFSPNRALFSKEVAGSHHQALLSSLLSVVASVGSIMGPLWMGATVGLDHKKDGEYSGPVGRVMFMGLIGLAVVMSLLVGLIWYWFFPPGGVINHVEKMPLPSDDEEVGDVADKLLSDD
uniref:Major facilitator superfamily associated domain-containing protein n=1 Tax=Octactis speculum TaxID=3111310 RepID=A0A7S2G2A3_9STRA